MFNFILQTIIMLSLGAMVYLVGRAAPRLSEEESLSEDFHIRLNKIIAKIPFEEIDVALSGQLEKILRRTKLFLMKWDNTLTHHLHKIKKTNVNNFQKEEKEKLFAIGGNNLENLPNDRQSAENSLPEEKKDNS